MANAINWFEIPATDFDRAKTFYGSILETELRVEEMGGMKMGMLPGSGPETVGGAIVHGQGVEPSEKGTMVYLNGGDDLSGILGRVESAGGSVVMPKTLIAEDIGYMAVFTDTEGNRLALHSSK